MITVIEAAPREAGLLTDIIKDAFAEEVVRNGCGPRDYDSVEARRKCMESGVRYFKIMSDGLPVGVISASVRGSECRIGVAAVLSAFKNRGIGFKAMTAVESFFPQAERFFLETPSGSVKNIRFYSKLGYRKFKEEADRYNGLRLVFMEKYNT